MSLSKIGRNIVLKDGWVTLHKKNEVEYVEYLEGFKIGDCFVFGSIYRV